MCHERDGDGLSGRSRVLHQKGEGYQCEAAYYSRKGVIDRANTQMRYAQEADEKAAMYLRWALGN